MPKGVGKHASLNRGSLIRLTQSTFMGLMPPSATAASSRSPILPASTVLKDGDRMSGAVVNMRRF